MADASSIMNAIAGAFNSGEDKKDGGDSSENCPHCGKHPSEPVQGNTLGARINYPGAEKVAE